MKRIILFTLFILVGFFYILCAEDIIKNPEKPINPTAGRIIKLKKVLEIPGVGHNYVIIHPYDLDFSADGNMYLTDEGQLLVFTPDGVCLKNLYQKGQGPGEMVEKKVWADISGDKIYIFDSVSKKLIIRDIEGKLIQEKKLGKRGKWRKSYRFIGLSEGKPLFWESEYAGLAQEHRRKIKNPAGSGRTVMDCKNTLLFYSLSTGETKIVGEFTTKWIVSSLGLSPMAQLRYRLYNDKLILSHTSEYLVNIVDLKSGNIKKVTRKFKRVEIPSSIPFKMGRKYLPDIVYFYIFKNYIWVRTMTRDKKKGPIYDVFDFKGRYVDSFYLGFNGIILNTFGDYLFISLADEDDNMYIAKYKVLDYYKPEKKGGKQ